MHGPGGWGGARCSWRGEGRGQGGCKGERVAGPRVDHASDPMPLFWMPASWHVEEEACGLLACWCFDRIIPLLGGRAAAGRAAKTLLLSLLQTTLAVVDHSGEKWLDSAPSWEVAHIFHFCSSLGLTSFRRVCSPSLLYHVVLPELLLSHPGRPLG